MSEVVLLCSLLQSYRLPRPLHCLLYRERHRLPFEGLIDYVVKLESSRTIPRCLCECGTEAEATSLSPFFCGYVSAVVDSAQLRVLHPIPRGESSQIMMMKCECWS